ncbi:hypothetical protein KVR01_000439 [Diaporthe batatas]|uniref:uncharacterized protein n=1 Tax=Diaporthe batatas TaxID=748121 RepID=UPI001D0592A1|nr:uncharacterized protein KVR01_000439 [Diaporthe batatas]KAG8169694.1 hypothetical protein KVR01_000439 [Diaporthe batatas]
MSSLWAQFWAARLPPADPVHLSYKDKAVLVTGANSGLGHEAAVKYAALGADPLILVVRTIAKGEQAQADIIRRTKCSPEIFIIETVDFTELASVKALGDRLASHRDPRVQQLHVAQLAAGVAQWQYEKSSEGYEVTLAVNVLSQALLAILLQPMMRMAATTASPDGFMPHLSFLHSIAGFEVTADWFPAGNTQSLIQRLNDQEKWDPTKQYFLAKFALWGIIEGLIQRCQEDDSEACRNIVINASCPSGCKTNMGRNFPSFVKPILALQHFICGRTAEQGARSLVGATALGSESTGKLWRNDKIQPPSDFMQNSRGREILQDTWKETLEILHQRNLM